MLAQLSMREACMEEFSAVLKVLGDPTRLRLLRLLLEARTEICVCELVDSLEESQYNVSKHVRALKAIGMVESRRDGRWVYYSAAPAETEFNRRLCRAVEAIPPEHAAKDMKELARRLRLRKDGRCLRGVQKLRFLNSAGAA